MAFLLGDPSTVICVVLVPRNAYLVNNERRDTSDELRTPRHKPQCQVRPLKAHGCPSSPLLASRLNTSIEGFLLCTINI